MAWALAESMLANTSRYPLLGPVCEVEAEIVQKLPVANLSWEPYQTPKTMHRVWTKPRARANFKSGRVLNCDDDSLPDGYEPLLAAPFCGSRWGSGLEPLKEVQWTVIPVVRQGAGGLACAFLLRHAVHVILTCVDLAPDGSRKLRDQLSESAMLSRKVAIALDETLASLNLLAPSSFLEHVKQLRSCVPDTRRSASNIVAAGPQAGTICRHQER